MNASSSTLPPSPQTLPAPYDGQGHHACRRFSWAAVFAGLVAALALEVLFMLLGSGLGFAIYDPITSDNPVASLGAGAMLIQGVSAVMSLWFGGWVAGRATPAGARGSACLHGFVVWCAATVVGVLLVSTSAGWILGDLSKIVGGGLSAAGKPAAAVTGGAADLARDALKQSNDVVTSFTEEAVGNRPPGEATPGDGIRAKREVGLALARLFNPAQEGKMAENRGALIKVLVEQTGMSEADATRAVEAWTASYDRLKADLKATKEAAEAKAREAADEAAKGLAIFSFAYFVGFVLGAVAASRGALSGAKCALKCENRAGTVA